MHNISVSHDHRSLQRLHRIASHPTQIKSPQFCYRIILSFFVLLCYFPSHVPVDYPSPRLSPFLPQTYLVPGALKFCVLPSSDFVVVFISIILARLVALPFFFFLFQLSVLTFSTSFHSAGRELIRPFRLGRNFACVAYVMVAVVANHNR